MNKRRLPPLRLAVCICIFTVLAVAAQPSPPIPPPIPSRAASFWPLEAPPWKSFSGQLPKAATNLNVVPSWDYEGTALSVATNVPAFLQLDMFQDGRTNISLESGSLEIWCQPNWTSMADGGTGPGSWATLWDIGSFTPDASIGAWLLTIDPSGSNLVWVAQSGGSNQMLWTPIDFDAGDWHQVVATWSASNSVLYVDGEPMTNAGAILYGPSSLECSNDGFCVGSLCASGTNAGTNQFQGQLQWLVSYAQPLTADEIANEYAEMANYIGYFGYSAPGEGGFHPDTDPPDPSGGSGGGSGTNGGGPSGVSWTPPAAISPTNYAAYDEFYLTITNDSSNAYVTICNTLSNLAYIVLTNGELANANGWSNWQILTASNSFTPAPPLSIGSNSLFFKAMLLALPSLAITLDPPPGVYAKIQQVSATCPTPGATIRYTTDGTTPTTSSPIVPSNSIVAVPYSLTLQTKAFLGGISGETSGGSYSIVGAIAAGFDHALYLSPYGNVYAWGDNSYGELGNGSTSNSSNPVQALNVTNATQIAASYGFSLALDPSGRLFGWGYYNNTDYPNPAALSLSNVVQAALGYVYILAMRTDGTAWSWGWNTYGQLGDGTTSDDWTPAAMLTNVSSVGAGYDFSLAISNGYIYGCGDTIYAQLASLSFELDTPTLIGGVSNVTSVQGCFSTSYALCEDHTVWSWGYGSDGELGNGTSDFLDFPGPVLCLSNVIQISASPTGDYCLALKDDGTVWAWGNNQCGNPFDSLSDYGMLGDGNNDPTNLPTMVIGLSNIVSISAGGVFAMALQNDGTIWGWGDNSVGELRNFTGSSTNAPVQILTPPYYTGQTPVLTISNGNNQVGDAMTMLPSPLLVLVTDTNGIALTNVPITFGAAEGDAQLLASNTGVSASSIVVLPNSNGIATAWAYLGTNLTDTIIAFARSRTNAVSVEFTEQIGPDITITSPANGSVALVGSNQTLNITVDAQAPAGASIQEVDYYYQTNTGGADTLLGVSTQSPYSFSWTNSLWWSNAFVGQYILSAVAVDNFGVESAAPSVAFTVALDSDGSGLPDYWQIENFGSLYGNATNLDSQGRTEFYDFENGLNPNIIGFSIAMTNIYVKTNHPAIPLNITWGLPSSMAVLVDTNSVSVYTNGPINFSTAIWQPYPTNVVLNAGDGSYSVWIGLRGYSSNSFQSWLVQTVILDTTPPVLTITNPASVVSRPMVQVQGYANEALASLTFDVSNAAGLLTNQTGYTTGQFTDTNLLRITTNYFQCYDIALTTNGANVITLHATDLAGNTTTTNLTVTLDYAGATNPPVITVLWPQDGTEIGGSQFTFQGQVDDPTATVIASIVDTNGNTNTVPALVERNGAFSAQNLPLAGGENDLTIRATDAAGNTSVTNLSVFQGSVTVTIDPLATNMLNQTPVTVTGTVSDPSYTVTVNGMTATVSTNGTWQATNVPVNPQGTAVFDVDATAGSDPEQVFSQPQGVNVVLKSYSIDSADYDQDAYQNELGRFGYTLHWLATGQTNEGIFGPVFALGWRTLDWTYESGGSDKGFSAFTGEMTLTGNIAGGAYTNWNRSLPATNIGFDVTWEYNPSQGTDTRVMVQPSGTVTIGTTVTYLVQAQAFYEDGSGQVPPASMKIEGTTLIPTTNSDGSLWGSTLVQAPAGAWPEVTPDPPNSNTFNVTASLANFIVDTNKNAISTAHSNNVAIIGQNINLYAYIPGIALSNFQWTVAGTTESDFYVSSDTAHKTGYPVPLTDTNSSSVLFFWLDDGPKSVICSAEFRGVTYSNIATFTVVKPLVLPSAVSGSVFIGTHVGIHYAPVLEFGNILDPPYGIYFSNTITMPPLTAASYYNYGNADYSNEWIQVLTNYNVTIMTSNTGSLVTHAVQVAGAVVDTSYPYEADTNATSDSPNITLYSPPLYSNALYATYTLSAEMWYMFEPTNGTWVPLCSVRWSCTGAATNYGSNNWFLTGATNDILILSTNFTTNYPIWGENSADFGWDPPF